MAHGPIPDALRIAFVDLWGGIVALKPKSWRREIAWWLVLYALVAFIFHLPPTQ